MTLIKDKKKKDGKAEIVFSLLYRLGELTLAIRNSMLTFRLVLVFACSLISYSPVTRTSLWISSRKHFLVFTGKKKEMENAD